MTGAEAVYYVVRMDVTEVGRYPDFAQAEARFNRAKASSPNVTLSAVHSGFELVLAQAGLKATYAITVTR